MKERRIWGFASAGGVRMVLAEEVIIKYELIELLAERHDRYGK